MHDAPSAPSIKVSAQNDGISSEQMEQLSAELQNSRLPRTERSVGGHIHRTYIIDVQGQHFELTVSDPIFRTATFAVTPMLGGGSNSHGVYISFNQYDQSVLIGGSYGLINAALCAIPAIGWVGCAAITAALVFVASYVSTHGACSGNKVMRVYINTFRVTCVKP